MCKDLKELEGVNHEKIRAEVTASAKALTRKPRVFEERKEIAGQSDEGKRREMRGGRWRAERWQRMREDSGIGSRPPHSLQGWSLPGRGSRAPPTHQETSWTEAPGSLASPM